MLDYSQLDTLATVLRLGSFEAAARQLNVTQSAISQRIRQLEESVGTPLVRRGQPCQGTETGQRLARHAAEVALLETRLDLRPHAAAPRLRIAVNADSLATWVLEALARHPEQLYEIVVDDQDHSVEWLKRGEVSAAITSVANPPQGCSSLPLGSMRYLAMASPEFVRNHFPEAVDKSSLAKAPMIVFNMKDSLQDIWIKKYLGVIHSPSSHEIPSTHGFIDAALLGMGWGMNPEALIAPYLADGRLVSLLPGCDLQVPLFWQSSRLMATALEPLSRSIRQVARQALLQPS